MIFLSFVYCQKNCFLLASIIRKIIDECKSDYCRSVSQIIGSSVSKSQNAGKTYCNYSQGAFKYYISTFFKILNPPPPPLHQRNQRGSRPPTPLYFADVILEHVVWVSILFRGLFPMLFMIVFGNKDQHQA